MKGETCITYLCKNKPVTRVFQETAEELVKMGISLPPDFAPGKGWSYSNTRYALTEKVTGNSYAEEVENRIIEPLELSNTFLPGNSTVIPGTKHAVDMKDTTEKMS